MVPNESFYATEGMPSAGIVGGQYFYLVCFPVSVRLETICAVKFSIVIAIGRGGAEMEGLLSTQKPRADKC